VVSRLRDEFVAGRLSQETFLHRMDAVLETKQQADLPPLLADLPRQQHRSLGARFRQAWVRLAGAADPADPDAPGQARGQAAGQRGQSRPPRWTGPRTVSPPQAVRNLTASLSAARDVAPPLALRFPRGSGSQFSIGRDASCDLAIADMTVSRRHATLERTAEGWLLSDLESTNGTRVNGWRVRGKVPVRAGDLVRFGNLETVFSRGDDLPRPDGEERREERSTSSMF
jgi:FHA domain/Domain of unknown function (DUF1707)